MRPCLCGRGFGKDLSSGVRVWRRVDDGSSVDGKVGGEPRPSHGPQNFCPSGDGWLDRTYVDECVRGCF